MVLELAHQKVSSSLHLTSSSASQLILRPSVVRESTELRVVGACRMKTSSAGMMPLIQ